MTPNVCDTSILDSNNSQCLCGSFGRRAAECWRRPRLGTFHFRNSSLPLPISYPRSQVPRTVPLALQPPHPPQAHFFLNLIFVKICVLFVRE